MPRPLRVLYVTHIASRSGNATSLRLLLEQLPREAVEPILLCPPGDLVPVFRQAGVRVVEIPGVALLQSTAGVPLRGRRLLTVLRTVWDLRHGWRVAGLLRELRPDIVHCNERGMIQVARLARRQGIPVIVHARSVADRDTRWIHRLSIRWLERDATCLVAIDQSVRHSLREVSRATVIYNPLNLQPGAPAAREPGAPVRVSFLNTLLAYKGIWDLFEAVRRLRHRRDIVFRIAGGNSRGPAFHRSMVGRLSRWIGLTRDVERELRDRVAAEGLGDTVHVLGHVDQPQRLLQDTDILVFPSHLNGAGRSVFEAGALGIPSVVTLRDRVEDIVEDGVTGLVVPERDPAALADAIQRLADDAPLRGRLGEAARRRYTVQFDPVAVAGRMLALYRELAGPRA